MTIKISKDVFNSAVDYDKHRAAALKSGQDMDTFTGKLLNAANASFDIPQDNFVKLDAQFDGTEKDFAIYFEHTNSDGQTSTRLIDLSFLVAKVTGASYQPTAAIRDDSQYAKNPNTNQYGIMRSPNIKMAIHAEHTDDLASFLFTWVHDTLPEEQREFFLDNCEQEGLVENSKGSIGFERPLHGEEPPSTAIN